MIDWGKKVNANDEEIAAAVSSRVGAYRAESDPLKMEAEYEAAITGSAPDYTLWIAKVKEIKARHPLHRHDDSKLN